MAPWPWVDTRAFNQATLDIGRAENTLVVDVYQRFKDHPQYFDDEAHFGVEGNRVAAELFHAELAKVIDQSLRTQ